MMYTQVANPKISRTTLEEKKTIITSLQNRFFLLRLTSIKKYFDIIFIPPTLHDLPEIRYCTHVLRGGIQECSKIYGGEKKQLPNSQRSLTIEINKNRKTLP